MHIPKDLKFLIHCGDDGPESLYDLYLRGKILAKNSLNGNTKVDLEEELDCLLFSKDENKLFCDTVFKSIRRVVPKKNLKNFTNFSFDFATDNLYISYFNIDGLYYGDALYFHLTFEGNKFNSRLIWRIESTPDGFVKHAPRKKPQKLSDNEHIELISSVDDLRQNPYTPPFRSCGRFSSYAPSAL